MSETTRRSFLGQLIAAASGVMVAAAGLMAAGEALAQGAKEPPRPKYGIAIKYGMPAPPPPDKDDKKKKKPPKKKCKKGEDCDRGTVRPKYGVPEP